MKKSNYIVLNVLLAMILMALGLLIELKGTKTVHGMSTIFMTVPGISLLLCLFLENINFKKLYIRFGVYCLVVTTIDFLTILLLKIKFASTGPIIGLVGSIITTTLINVAFYLIFSIIKKKPGFVTVK